MIGCCLTSRGEGGLHVFRLRGPGTGALLARMFRPASGKMSGAVRYGHLLDGDEIIDEVMVHRAGDGGDAVEISTHGGHAIREAVSRALERAGVREVEPRLLFDRGHGPAIRDEAFRGLDRAFSVQSLLFHLAVLDGALAGEAKLLCETLLRGDGSSFLADAVRMRIDALLSRAPFGLAFGEPPQVLVAGPPNAGKSTLANQILGSDRCIVTAEPGTTRDLVGERLSLGGYPFRIVDSAGVRTTSDPVESLGVQRTFQESAVSALVLLVVDGSVPFPDDVQVHRLLDCRDVVVVLNKGDLDVVDDEAALSRRLGRTVVRASALAGEGIDRLGEAILYRSPFRGPATRDLPCPFTRRQVGCLEAARAAVGTDVRAAAAALSDLLEGAE